MMNGRSSPAPRGGERNFDDRIFYFTEALQGPVADLKANEKANSSAVSLQDNPKLTWGNELPSQVGAHVGMIDWVLISE